MMLQLQQGIDELADTRVWLLRIVIHWTQVACKACSTRAHVAQARSRWPAGVHAVMVQGTSVFFSP
jgi:hypothetical protein